MKFLIKTISIVLIVSSSAYDSFGQENLYFPKGKVDRSFALTGGLMYLLYGNVELSMMNNLRIGNKAIFEYKPLAGIIRQLYLFEGNSDRYTIGYAGGTLGVLIGGKGKYFDLSLGAGYFFGDIDSMGDLAEQILPIGDIGFRNEVKGKRLKVGIGFPKGLFVSIFLDE